MGTRARDGAFAAYRFGDVGTSVDCELGSENTRAWRRPGDGRRDRSSDGWGADDDGGGQAKERRWRRRPSGALDGIRAWGRANERVVWLALAACVVAGRLAIAGGRGRGGTASGAMGVTPVTRRSVMERAIPSVMGMEKVEELIIVPGSAVYSARDFSAAKEETSWALGAYQLVQGEARTFLEHMEIGVKAAAKNQRSMLIFSGGKTSREAGSLSEAASYWQVARALEWFGADAGVERRTFTEEHARDSLENLLFSMCRFFEISRRFPKKITVVGYQVKSERFSQHLQALGFPSGNFSYMGTTAVNEAEMKAGEVRLRAAYAQDPYGCRGDLAAKRLQRDPFNVGAPYSTQVKVLSALWLHINTCSQRLFKDKLPWSPGVILR